MKRKRVQKEVSAVGDSLLKIELENYDNLPRLIPLEAYTSVTLNHLPASFAHLLHVLVSIRARALNVSQNGLEDKQAEALAKVIALTPIQSLNISYNLLSPLGIAALIEQLHSSQVNTLIVGLNQIGYQGKLIISALKDSPVRTLDMRGNGLGVQGMENIASCLKEAPLTALRLRRNFIQDAGLLALGKVLKDTAIELLDLTANELFITGLKQFLALVRGTHLAVLKLSRNFISNSEIKSLAPYIAGTSLVHIKLKIYHPSIANELQRNQATLLEMPYYVCCLWYLCSKIKKQHPLSRTLTSEASLPYALGILIRLPQDLLCSTLSFLPLMNSTRLRTRLQRAESRHSSTFCQEEIVGQTVVKRVK